ncbi:MAG: sigma-70 family RNA polymerase sigma factor [Patescibacteria group bacterium]|nr:sigma-70 family RNA polymerase sigma factor [Patescibacteria group bacterium]
MPKANTASTNLISPTDAELVAQALADDRAALEQLVKRYLTSVYQIAKFYVYNAQDAEDVTQEVFVKVWKNLERFQPQKKFSSWISEITKNTALDLLKKKRELAFSNFEDEAGVNLLTERLADSAPGPEEQAHKSGMAEKLRAAVNRLSGLYRRVVEMRDFEGLTFQEIADRTDESINTIKSRYRRATFQLKKLL